MFILRILSFQEFYIALSPSMCCVIVKLFGNSEGCQLFPCYEQYEGLC
jgi:hypothetical protein